MTDDPRHFALQAALRRMRVHLEQAVADNDAAIAAWDAIDDRRLDDESLPDTPATGQCAPASPIPFVTDEALIAASRALGLTAGHTFADVRTMTPGPNTVAMTRTMMTYLSAWDWSLVRMHQGIDAEVEVTNFEDAEHQWQNAETGERRRGSPIIPRRWPDGAANDEASHA